MCAVDSSVEEVHDFDGNGILRCAWIGTPRTIVSTKRQPLFEMTSFIGIIINEQTNGVSVLRQIVEGSDDKIERKTCAEKVVLRVYTCLKIEIALSEASLGWRDTIGVDD